MSTRVQVADFLVVLVVQQCKDSIYRQCGNDMQRSAHYVLVKGASVSMHTSPILSRVDRLSCSALMLGSVDLSVRGLC